MDPQTLDSLADLLCGDSIEHYPKYRKFGELVTFFENLGLNKYSHKSSTRKWWALGILKQLPKNELMVVICRLADPKEYKGNQKLVAQAVSALNEALMVEGLKVELDGVNPKMIEITPQFIERVDNLDLRPLPPPDFLKLKLDPQLGAILAARWDEAQKCIRAEAYLAAIIIMGSLLEGMLLAVMRSYPQEANQAKLAPADPTKGKVKHFAEWTLADMINVAHEDRWIDLDVQKFSHALREFRNLVHPHEHLALLSFPDKDTCDISWLVVQAASNDLAKN